MRIIPVGFPFGDLSLPFDERREREAVPNKKERPSVGAGDPSRAALSAPITLLSIAQIAAVSLPLRFIRVPAHSYAQFLCISIYACPALMRPGF